MPSNGKEKQVWFFCRPHLLLVCGYPVFKGTNSWKYILIVQISPISIEKMYIPDAKEQ